MRTRRRPRTVSARRLSARFGLSCCHPRCHSLARSGIGLHCGSWVTQEGHTCQSSERSSGYGGTVAWRPAVAQAATATERPLGGSRRKLRGVPRDSIASSVAYSASTIADIAKAMRPSRQPRPGRRHGRPPLRPLPRSWRPCAAADARCGGPSRPASPANCSRPLTASLLLPAARPYVPSASRLASSTFAWIAACFCSAAALTLRGTDRGP